MSTTENEAISGLEILRNQCKYHGEWKIIYDKVCSLENKYANNGDMENVNCCIKLENYLQYFKEELKSEEEYKGGWIPYVDGCKMPNEASRVWLSFTTPVASFVKSAWYINGNFEWDNCRKVKETPTAWKPFGVPAPYTEGE